MSGYPVILCGDHAEFEKEWAANGRPDNERPDWPLPSFDAQDWARAFCDVCIEKGFRPTEDDDWVTGWFANALMRGYDQKAAEIAKDSTSHTPARLIAAAPDLLAAVKSAVDTIEIYHRRNNPHWDGHATPESVIGTLRAAIAKAEAA
jgi:hypothetical protein